MLDWLGVWWARCRMHAPAICGASLALLLQSCSTMLLRFGMLQTADDFIDELASDGVELVLANPIQQVRLGWCQSKLPLFYAVSSGAGQPPSSRRSSWAAQTAASLPALPPLLA